MNTIINLADIDRHLLYFLDVESILTLMTISKNQRTLMLEIDFIKELRLIIEKYVVDPNIIDYQDAYGYAHYRRMHDYLSVLYIFTDNLVDLASATGYIHILDWLHNSVNEFTYTETTIDKAIKNNHVNVLNWFVNSKYKFIYTTLEQCLINKNIKILKWFDESKYEIKYHEVCVQLMFMEDKSRFDYLGTDSRILKRIMETCKMFK